MCTNPALMRSIELNDKTFNMIPRLKKLGFSIDKYYKTAYKFVGPNSRSMPLEEIPDYVNQTLIEIGCGCCIECRLQYSKDWANRCYLESLNYNHNYFITVTYDDEHLPISETTGNPTINKDHITDFIHSLRDKFRNKLKHLGVRYFGCQEYGDLYNRPHGHLIFFNCPIPDLTIDIETNDGSIIHKKNPVDGSWYLWSRFVKECWPYGNILIADVNFNTSSYVSRYILKKQKGENSSIYEDKLGIEPPYVFMSTRPGIGLDYLKSHRSELFKDSHLYVPRLKNGKPDVLVSGLPRYFLKKIKDSNFDWYNRQVNLTKDKQASRRSLLDHSINTERTNKEASDNLRFNAFARELK